MAMQLSVAVRNAMADALVAQVGNAGLLRIYTGAIPADCATAASGTLLSEHTLGTPFDAAASGGGLTPNLPADVNASNTGVAGYYRVYRSDGTTCVQQAPIADITITPSTTITSGQPVKVTSWTITMGGA